LSEICSVGCSSTLGKDVRLLQSDMQLRLAEEGMQATRTGKAESKNYLRSSSIEYRALLHHLMETTEQQLIVDSMAFPNPV